ncbi:hypothetical protein C8J57DRAFT_443518 [Mycena rebaudengoi]|nr:hypothetical protein C8J57DRAFT_443518 [Mycena rebaudengoi]
MHEQLMREELMREELLNRAPSPPPPPVSLLSPEQNLVYRLKHTTDSPIARLPLELLQDVFILCLPPDPFPSPGPLLAPLVLAWVSRLWRAVARSLPALWSSLSLEYPWDHMRSARHCAWLSRAKSFWLAHAARRTRLSLSLRGGFCQTRDYLAFLTLEGFAQRTTTLDLQIAVSLPQALLLLRHTFVLADCTISSIQAPCSSEHHDVLHEDARDPVPTGPIELDSLRTLRLASAPPVEDLLCCLVTPNLRTLALTQHNTSLGAYAAVPALLARSGAQLTSFEYTTDQIRGAHHVPVAAHAQQHYLFPLFPGAAQLQLQHQADAAHARALATLLRSCTMQSVRRLAVRGVPVDAGVVEVLGGGVSCGGEGGRRSGTIPVQFRWPRVARRPVRFRRARVAHPRGAAAP